MCDLVSAMLPSRSSVRLTDYLEKAKPMLTENDKFMPMAVRRALHDLVDDFWWSLMQELPETIDKVLNLLTTDY